MTQELFPAADPEQPAPDAAAPDAVAADASQPGDVCRIGEVCRLTATKPFVLRYWETEFPMLAPQKSPKGHRLYRREDVDMVFEIKRLLYEQGFTIAGARRWLESSGREEPEAETAPVPTLPSGSTAARKILVDLEQELRAMLTLLESE